MDHRRDAIVEEIDRQIDEIENNPELPDDVRRHLVRILERDRHVAWHAAVPAVRGDGRVTGRSLTA